MILTKATQNPELMTNEQLNREVARYEGVEFTDENDPTLMGEPVIRKDKP